MAVKMVMAEQCRKVRAADADDRHYASRLPRTGAHARRSACQHTIPQLDSCVAYRNYRTMTLRPVIGMILGCGAAGDG